MVKRKFSELTPTQQRLVAIGGAIQIALQLWALLDLKRRDDEQVRGSKRLWRAASFINFAGPIAYLTVGRKG